MAGDNSSRCSVVGINQLPPAAIPHLFRSFGQSYNAGHHDRCQNTVAKWPLWAKERTLAK